ncbi:MAG: tRNA 2-selenouridine(34) synthase MnmH [Candidatus Nanoarchaeia archaeon]|nr:tRNA 2-selenouridine(34) synthase MnmH [Candidatus Nanoarchaeia archaeon]
MIQDLKGIERKTPTNEICVSEFEKIRKDCLVFDVRSPLEFDEFHVIGSINLPLLQDEARKIVGTIYRQAGQQEAVNQGWKEFEKNFKELISKAKMEISKKSNKKIIVYCARGGMRSGIVTNLLEHLGYEVYRLIGGIKEYRNSLYGWLDEILDTWKPKFVVLEGMTGTRKTEFIQNLNVDKLDLEDLANHRASTYGGVGLKERSQKMFLFLLYEELLKLKNCDKVVVEGESKKIGKIFLPEKLFDLMLSGDFVHVVASNDVRINHVIKEYCSSKEKVEELIALTPRLVKFIGKKKVDEVVSWFEKGEYYLAVEFLLLEYYDKVYKNFAKEYVFEISTDDLKIAKKGLEEFLS